MYEPLQDWLDARTDDDGTGTTGDLINVALLDGMLTVVDAEIKDSRPSDYDTVTFGWTDGNTITINAGGHFVTRDGAEVITINANITLSLSTGRSVDCASEAANTYYYVWVGKNSGGTVVAYFHTSATSMPSELVVGRRLRAGVRNNNISDIIPFAMLDDYYHYNSEIVLTGGDLTEVFDGTLSSAGWSDLIANGLVPDGDTMIRVAIKQADARTLYYRYYNVSAAIVPFCTTATTVIIDIPVLGNLKIAQLKNDGASSTTRASVVGYPI